MLYWWWYLKPLNNEFTITLNDRIMHTGFSGVFLAYPNQRLWVASKTRYVATVKNQSPVFTLHVQVALAGLVFPRSVFHNAFV